jgi:polysaccharide transporter, PST family
MCGTIGAWFLGVSFKPCWGVRGSGIREMLRLGSNVTGFNMINYFHRNLDNMLIGRVWGAQQLGLYSRAYSLLMLSINNLRVPLNAVAFPTMSRLQSQPDKFRTYYVKYCSLLAFAYMPVVSFLFVSSNRIVNLLLGSQWAETSE